VLGAKTQAVAGKTRAASGNAQLVSGSTYHVDGKQQVVVLRGNGPVLVRRDGVGSVGERLSRLRQLARADFIARR
jgi:hypothetical protein